MLSQSIRASRSSLVRRVARQPLLSRRSLITPTAVRQADIVQELYLKELKVYKPAAVKSSDSEGHVQKFSAPKTPKSPEETDIANELKAYESSTVELEGQAPDGSSSAVEQDWFEEEEEDEHAKAH